MRRKGGNGRESLHERVAVRLREELTTRYRAGDKLPSEAELARSFDVSVHTIREALSVLASEGLVVRRHGAGTYRAEPSLERHVAVYCELDLSHPRAPYFFLRVVQQSYLILSDHGLPVKLYIGHCPPERDLDAPTCPEFLEAVREDRISVLLAVGISMNSVWFVPLEERGVPMVGIPQGYNIAVDFPGMIDEAVRRIRDAGRTRVAMIGPSPELFRASMARHGLGVRDEWIGHRVHPLHRGAGQAEFLSIWRAEEEKPDAVLFTDDVLFQDAALAILSLGVSVPDELLVLSHANRGAVPSLPFPFLAMEFDPDAFAQNAAEQVIRLYRGDDVDTAPVMCPYRCYEVSAESVGVLAEARSQ